MLALNWFDVISVTVTFGCIFILQIINIFLQTNERDEKSKIATDQIIRDAISSISTATTTTTTTTATAVNKDTTKTTPPSSPIRTSLNGKLDKQTSLDDENGVIPLSSTSSSSSSSSPTTISAPTSVASSLSALSTQNGVLVHTLSFDTLGDEYQVEDEDTLSLENLFPCDQTEIYATKKISFIIDELIQTEANYVNNLRKGLANYGELQKHASLPEALQGAERQRQLMTNIEEILELHEQQILPMMLRNQRDLKGLFDEFAAHFDKNNFYCYVIFTMGKKASMQLRQENREWFQLYQTEIKDKLGIDSFLVQPIQRLTRYPLLLQQFISEFYKSGISCKPVLTSVCKLETRMRRLLDVVNQAEEISNIEETSEFDLTQLGNFRRATEFDANHLPTRKKYHAKVFLFDRCLLCAELRKRRLVYRHHYNWEKLELQRPLTATTGTIGSSKSITLLVKGEKSSKSEEYIFVGAEASTVKQWLQTTHKIIETARYEYSQRGKFSLPMDLVLGVGFAIWLIWRYL